MNEKLVNKEKIDKAYEYLIKYAPKGECRSLSERAPHRLRAMGFPEELIYFWQQHGFCSYGDGLWWHTNPAEYHEVVELWLRGTKFWQPKTNPYYVIGRSAFGHLELWGKNTGNDLGINTLDGRIIKEDSFINRYPIDAICSTFIKGGASDYYDIKDSNGTPLFQRALQKLGPLQWHEMYAPVPAPIFSGGLTIDNVQKVELLTQQALLREMVGELQIIEFNQ